MFAVSLQFSFLHNLICHLQIWIQSSYSYDKKRIAKKYIWNTTPVSKLSQNVWSDKLIMLDSELTSTVATLLEGRLILSPTSISFCYKKSGRVTALAWIMEISRIEDHENSEWSYVAFDHLCTPVPLTYAPS